MKYSLYFSDESKMEDTISYLKEISGLTGRNIGDIVHECVTIRTESFYKNFKGCEK